MAMWNASIVRSVEKSIRTIKEGVRLGDAKKCAAAYRFARKYNRDLPNAPASLAAYPNVILVLSLRVERASEALAAAR